MLDRWSQQGAQLAGALLVARLIGPQAFGTAALVLLALTFLQGLLLDGLTDAVLRRQRLTRGGLATAVWASALAGLLVLALLAAAAAAAAAATGTAAGPGFMTLLLLGALSLPATGPAAVLDGLARRQQRFRLLALRGVLAHGPAWGLAVLLAAWGQGALAMVAAQATLRWLELALLVAGLGLPRPRITRPDLVRLLRDAADGTAMKITGFLVLQAERVLIGTLAGPAALGLYGLARRLVDNLVFALAGVAGPLLFRDLSRLPPGAAADPLRRQAGLLALAAAPAFLGLAVVAGPLLAALLGPAWADAAALLPLLALGGLFTALAWLLIAALRALGGGGEAVRTNLLLAFVKITAVLLALPQGLTAVAWVDPACALLGLGLWAGRLHRLCPALPRAALAAAWSPLLLAAGMAALVAALARLLPDHLPPAAALTLLIGAGIGLYTLGLRLTGLAAGPLRS